MAEPTEVNEVCSRANDSREWLREDRERRSDLLDGIAAALDARRDEILVTCSQETGLTPAELAPEFARMVDTLRVFARAVREGSWVRAAIDRPRAVPADSIGPNHDVRRMLVPVDGVVAVFGASNFPLAYGVCGGDTASALGAGCSVVVKEHPAHPKTGRLLHDIAASVVKEKKSGDLLGYVGNEDPRDLSVAKSLVEHDHTAAVGFTGSRSGGMALDGLARNREKPIPVFAEMGSANRVVICRSALARRGTQIAAELAASIVARHGQQCTKPGLIVLEQDQRAGPAFVAELARLLDAAPPRRMLSQRVTDEYVEKCRRLRGIPLVTRATQREDPEVVVRGERRTVPMLFASMDEARGNLDALQMFTPDGRGYWLNEEVFGPAAVVIGSDGWENFYYADPALVTTVYAEPDDFSDLVDDEEFGIPSQPAFRVRQAIRTTGRFTFNSVPTGVRVAHAMVHGGPFPATNRPDTTAVGPFAIERWCRPVCFQNCPQELLPPELQDSNPLGIMRIVDGEWTRAAIGA
jgi:NADP-dependent aldehyde dehydrogenase